jgi:hypothetical protein
MQQAGVHLIDVIALFQFGYAERPALGTAAGLAQMQPVPMFGSFNRITTRTAVDREVLQAVLKGPMYSSEPFAALFAFPHSFSFISQFAQNKQGGRQ